MADRTSARVFGQIFEMLAENPTEEHRAIAQRVFSMTYEYDFNPYQMSANGACLKLGVAREGTHREYPEDGKIVLWPGNTGYEEAEVAPLPSGKGQTKEVI